MGAAEAMQVIATGGLWGLVLLAGFGLASFVVALVATRLLDDVELEYQSWIFRCHIHVRPSRCSTSCGKDDEPSPR